MKFPLRIYKPLEQIREASDESIQEIVIRVVRKYAFEYEEKNKRNEPR